MEKRVLVFDLGASGGRAMLGIFDGETIRLEEIHRFENSPVRLGDILYWDLHRLFYEIKQGISKASLSGGFDSIGTDTWGVDFGLIGEDGNITEAPVHYRDGRTDGMPEKAFKLISAERMYDITGIQLMQINTVFQLLSLKLGRPHILDNSYKMLMLPDLFNYLLTGVMKTEMSIASTTQMLDAVNRCWSDEIIEGLGLPKKLFTDIVPSGTVIGRLREDIRKELDAPEADVIAVCGHDTQCAALAAPLKEDGDFTFISCGTWSLFGTELNQPVINEKSRRFNLASETGYGNKTTFLKNIIGLWLIQESRRQFRSEGREYSFAEIEKLAGSSKPFACFINPDAPELTPQGDIPERVREFCKRTGQYIPQSDGEVMRCVYESLALKYRQAFDEIISCTGKGYNKIYLFGGGSKDSLLCGMTANACGCDVTAGPVEATAYGNAAIQLISSGFISDVKQARRIIAKSAGVKVFKPREREKWEKAYAEYKKYQ